MKKTKVKKVKKPTKEEILKKELLDTQRDAGIQAIKANELYTENKKLNNLIRDIYFFIMNVAKLHNQTIEREINMMHVRSPRGYGRYEEGAEMKPEEMIQSGIAAVASLAHAFAREDEGTALMTEHKNDLMILLRAAIEDSTRPNDELREKILLGHNLATASKNGDYLDPEGKIRRRGPNGMM